MPGRPQRQDQLALAGEPVDDGGDERVGEPADDAVGVWGGQCEDDVGEPAVGGTGDGVASHLGLLVRDG